MASLKIIERTKPAIAASLAPKSVKTLSAPLKTAAQSKTRSHTKAGNDFCFATLNMAMTVATAITSPAPVDSTWNPLPFASNADRPDPCKAKEKA